MPTMVASSLIDRVPRKALTYMIWSTAVFDAQRALTWGIVSDVFPAASLELNAKKFLDQLLSAPRPAQRAVKEYAAVAFDMSTPGAVDFARNLHATINSSSEMKRKH
jgi:enoyl-CoA hydratase